MALESDWVLIKESLKDLREYILSPEIYWTLRPPSRSPGGVQLPQLTLGNLLLGIARLTAAQGQLSAEQNAELAEYARQIHALREEWRSNWGLKAGREFSSRLNLWQNYVRELRGGTQANTGYYPREVRNRAILRLLVPEILQSVPANEQEQLNMLDQVLRGITRKGPFVWEPELADGFPEEGFWFLYVSLNSKS